MFILLLLYDKIILSNEHDGLCARLCVCFFPLFLSFHRLGMEFPFLRHYTTIYSGFLNIFCRANDIDMFIGCPSCLVSTRRTPCFHSYLLRSSFIINSCETNLCPFIFTRFVLGENFFFSFPFLPPVSNTLPTTVAFVVAQSTTISVLKRSRGKITSILELVTRV